MRTGVAKDRAKDKNVVHARLKRIGLRFELSVYRDKVPSKQDLASKDFHPNWLEILAAQVVFSNAAKNEVADKADVTKAFPDMQDGDIFRQILEKGDIQATLEDRNEHMAESIHTLAKLSAAIAAMTHVRPSEEDTQDKKKKHRLTRYTAQDVERELKNIRYKHHDAAVPLHDQAVDAIAAIHRANNLPIFRDARTVSIHGSADVMSEVPKALAAATSLFRPCDFKVLRVTQDTVHALADYTLDVVALSKKDATLAQASWSTTDEFYVPTHSDGSDDLTSLVAAATAATKPSQQPSGGGGGKKGNDGAKPKPGAKASQKKGDAVGSDDDEDNEGESHHRRGVGSLEDELKRLQREDSDDEGRGKGKGKAKGGKQPAPKQAAAAPKPAPPAKASGSQKKGGRRDEFESDEDNA